MDVAGEILRVKARLSSLDAQLSHLNVCDTGRLSKLRKDRLELQHEYREQTHILEKLTQIGPPVPERLAYVNRLYQANIKKESQNAKRNAIADAAFNAYTNKGRTV